MPSLTSAAGESRTITIEHWTDATGLKPYSRVLAIFLCGAFAFLDLFCTQPLLPLLAHVFRASETSVSLTISAPTLGVALSAILLALFAERVDRKQAIVGSMMALSVVTFLTATASNLHALIAWRFLQGLLTPGIFIITIAYITEEWPAALVPRVMSVYVAGTVFGGFLGRVAGGILAEHFSWQVMFLILGAVGAMGALITQRILKRSLPKPHLAAYIGSRLDPFWNSLRNPRLVATFCIGFCMLLALVSLFSYVTFYLAEPPFQLSTEALGWLFSVYLLGLMTTLVAGAGLARVGLRYGMVAAILLCIAGVVLTLAPSLMAVGLGLAAASSGVFVAQTCASSFLREAAPEGSRVSAAGIYVCSYYAGGTAGGILPGLLWHWGGWPGCVALICTFLLIACTTAFFGWRPRALELVR
ncbi:MAG TPA: MFS transporter [Bryobacteraceae bacterium]